MHLEHELHLAAELTPERLDQFHRDLPTEWIEEALYATGTATVRRRRLPAEQVVWLVLGMALMRDRPISDVVDKLDLALPANGKREPVARSAVAQARARLGDEPMEWLFLRSADAWAHAIADRRRWRGLALYGVDGRRCECLTPTRTGSTSGASLRARPDAGRAPILWCASQR